MTSIRLSKSEERQRRQLASRLHESVSQELFVAQLKLNALVNTSNDPAYSRQLEEINEQIVKSIKDIRGITYDQTGLSHIQFHPRSFKLSFLIGRKGFGFSQKQSFRSYTSVLQQVLFDLLCSFEC